MNKTLDELNALYAGYDESLAQAKQGKGKMQDYFGGLFRSSSDTDGFSDKFADNVKLCLERFASERPESPQALEVMRFVLSRGKKSRNSIITMQEAVQGFLTPVVPFLSSSDAQAILDEYYSDKRAVRRLLPVQKTLMQAIRERA